MNFCFKTKILPLEFQFTGSITQIYADIMYSLKYAEIRCINETILLPFIFVISLRYSFFFFFTQLQAQSQKKLNKYIDTASTYVDLSHDFWIIVEAKSLSRFGCYESALTLLQFELMEENGKKLNYFQQSTCLLSFINDNML